MLGLMVLAPFIIFIALIAYLAVYFNRPSASARAVKEGNARVAALRATILSR